MNNDHLENWIKLGIGIISLILRLGVPPMHVTKTQRWGTITFSNYKIGTLNTPTYLPSLSKYCMNVHPLYEILGDADQKKVVVYLFEINEIKGLRDCKG